MDYDDVIERAAKAMAETNNDYEDGVLQWSPYVDDARAAAPILMEYSVRLMREVVLPWYRRNALENSIRALDPAKIVGEG